MRHFSLLLPVLAFYSLLTSTDCLQSAHSSVNTAAIAKASGHAGRLHHSLPRTTAANGNNPNHNAAAEVSSRRRALQAFVGGSLFIVAGGASAARALDMDAFVNSQVRRKLVLLLGKLVDGMIPEPTSDPRDLPFFVCLEHRSTFAAALGRHAELRPEERRQVHSETDPRSSLVQVRAKWERPWGSLQARQGGRWCASQGGLIGGQEFGRCVCHVKENSLNENVRSTSPCLRCAPSAY